MRTLLTASLTEGHRAMVTPDNYRELTRGTFSNPRQDGTELVVTTAVQDAEALRRVDAGDACECSAGYELDWDPTPGAVPDGQPDAGEHYDGIQRNRVYNHVAYLPRGAGRAGPSVGLRFDAADADAFTRLGACYSTEVNGNRSDATQEQHMAFRFDG